MEKAEPGLRLSALVAVCLVLGLTSGFDALVPAIEFVYYSASLSVIEIE